MSARSASGSWKGLSRWLSERIRSDPSGAALGLGLAVLVVAIAYAASRAGEPWAGVPYWLGEALIYAVPAVVLLRARRISRTDGALIALLVALASYVVNQAYSPGQMRFLDEFEHVVTTQGILSTHHLFAPNISLLVSPQYPALEIVTSAIVQVTHLSIAQSGIVLVGVLHLASGFGVYLLALEFLRSPRWAALALLIYAGEPHFQFFDAYFIYEVMAFPFLVACLLATVRGVKAASTRASVLWQAAAVGLAGIVVISHHLSSYILWILLLAFAVGFAIGRYPLMRLLQCVAALVLIGLMVAGWDLKLATATVGYIEHNLPNFGIGGAATGPATGTAAVRSPLLDTSLEYVGVGLLGVLLVAGVWWLWRSGRCRDRGLWIGVATASGLFVVALCLRVVLGSGAELWGRLATFALVPGCIVVAAGVRVVVRRARTSGAVVLGYRSRQVAALSGVALVVLIGLGGIAGGWPPFYARLPGPFLAAAWERSVDARELSLAAWAAARATRNNGVASDLNTASILATLGHQANVGALPELFRSPHLNRAGRQALKSRRVSWVVVDLRLTRLRPMDGSYFSGSGGRASGHRLPAAGMRKFASIPGVSTIYSDGELLVYDLTGAGIG